MTMTDECVVHDRTGPLPLTPTRGSAAPGTQPRGPLTLSYARGLEEQRAATEHRRRLQLVLVGAGSAALGLALALILAWEADRWLTDWHYRDMGPDGYAGAEVVE